MDILRIGNSQVNYNPNIGNYAKNNNVYLGDSADKKPEPTTVQKAINKTGQINESGADLVKSLFGWMNNILNNFTFYLFMIVVILLLALSLYIFFPLSMSSSWYKHIKKKSN
jgi:hypothetical protein